MFSNQELALINQVLSQLSFKPGQGGQMIAVELIMQKIEKQLKTQEEKEPKKEKSGTSK